MNWNEPPDIDRVHAVLDKIGKIKAKIKFVEQQIREKAVPIKKEKSRSPWLVDEACQDEYRVIASLESDLAELEAEKEFLNYWKEMYKVSGYINR